MIESYQLHHKATSLKSSNVHRLLELHDMWNYIDVKKDCSSFSEMLTRCFDTDKNSVSYVYRANNRSTCACSSLPDMYEDEEIEYLENVIRAAQDRLKELKNKD